MRVDERRGVCDRDTKPAFPAPGALAEQESCLICARNFRLAERPAEDDPRDRAADDEVHRFDVADLITGIEDDDKEQTERSTDHRREDGFERHDYRTSGTAVRIGQVPLATGTGGHAVGSRPP